MNKLWIVTGDRGFIGSHFVEMLLECADNYVLGIDSYNYAANLPYTLPWDDSRRYLSFEQFIDIVDVNEVKAKIQELLGSVDAQPFAFVHFAAESSVDVSIDGGIVAALEFTKSNTVGTVNALCIAKKLGMHFHYVSTDEVFGQVLSEFDPPFTINSQVSPRNTYSASKASADLIIKSLCDVHKYDGITMTNCCNNFGERQNIEKLIPQVVHRITSGKPVLVYGSGNQFREWVYVKDHCSVIMNMINRHANSKGGLIRATVGGRLVRNLDMVHNIGEVLGLEPNIEYVVDRKNHDFGYKIEDMSDEYSVNVFKDWYEKFRRTVESFREA